MSNYHQPRIFRPVGTIGMFGVNTPEEVKTLQKMMINAGYNHINGNRLRATGQCDPETQAAIIWYQRLLNLSPSGMVHPQQSWFFSMFSRAIAPHWRPRDIGPLYVREGQFTFDAEGVDYLTAVEPFRQPTTLKHFSRILYWPGKRSGVTLGRGYDMKERSPGEIMTHLRQAGIEEYKAIICSKGAGFAGIQAANFVKAYGPLVGEITHLQQVRLFEIAFQVYVKRGMRIFNSHKAKINSTITWDMINKKIKDVYLDSLYQGCYSASLFAELIAKGDVDGVKDYLLTDVYQNNSYGRNVIRLKYINDVH